jgi:hypothetical protein
MKQHLRKTALVLLTILLGASACNLPGGTPQVITQLTPDTTITALFEFISTAQAQMTSVVAQPATATATTAPPVVSLASATPTLSASPTSTEEPEPTETEAPSSSGNAGPSRRPRNTVVAYYLQEEPTIDGVFDEWDLDRYSVSSVVYGGNRWDGADDLSATFMIAWDDYYLYIAARVIDDEYVQNATGKNLFKGDSIEVLLDINVPKDYYDNDLSLDDFQFGVSPGPDTPSDDIESYVWYPRSRRGVYNTIKAAALPTDDGYRIEVKIPWEIMDITPDIGKHYGFAFSVSDNDDPDENVQQSMVSNVATRRLTNPTTWGDLRLEGKP